MVLYTIYEIVCRDENVQKSYVGHTDDFEERMGCHRSNSKSKSTKKNQSVHIFIKEHGGWDNWDMKMIETIECDDREEARKREQYWMNIKNTLGLNVNRAYVSEQKRYIEKESKKMLNDMERKQKLVNQMEKYLEDPNEHYKKYYEKYKKQVDNMKAKLTRQENIIKMVDDNINHFI